MPGQLVDRLLDEQDREFIRVLEDLIDVLLDEKIISLDMLPPRAAEKFVERRQLRGESEVRIRRRIDIRKKMNRPMDEG